MATNQLLANYKSFVSMKKGLLMRESESEHTSELRGAWNPALDSKAGVWPLGWLARHEPTQAKFECSSKRDYPFR